MTDIITRNPPRTYQVLMVLMAFAAITDVLMGYWDAVLPHVVAAVFAGHIAHLYRCIEANDRRAELALQSQTGDAAFFERLKHESPEVMDAVLRLWVATHPHVHEFDRTGRLDEYRAKETK